MKLTYVLKGHTNDKAVMVTNNVATIEWSGKGIEGLISRTQYYKEWLDKQVKRVYKENGKTIVVVR